MGGLERAVATLAGGSCSSTVLVLPQFYSSFCNSIETRKMFLVSLVVSLMQLCHTCWTLSPTGNKIDLRARDFHIFSLALVFKCWVSTDLFEGRLVQQLDEVLFYLCLGFWRSTVAIVVMQIQCHPHMVGVAYLYKRFDGQNKLVFLTLSVRGSGWGLTDSRELVKIFDCQLKK